MESSNVLHSGPIAPECSTLLLKLASQVCANCEKLARLALDPIHLHHLGHVWRII